MTRFAPWRQSSAPRRLTSKDGSTGCAGPPVRRPAGPPVLTPLDSGDDDPGAFLKIFHGWRMVAAGAGIQFLHAGLLLQGFRRLRRSALGGARLEQDGVVGRRRAAIDRRGSAPWTTLHLCNHPLENQAIICPWDGVKTNFRCSARRVGKEQTAPACLRCFARCSVNLRIRLSAA